MTDLTLPVKDKKANSEEMIQDHVVFEIHSPSMREKLLSVGPELTLDKPIGITRSHKIAQAQLKTIAGGNHGPH